MWQPSYIKSYNLTSFSVINHNFTPECYVVQGENRTDDGQQSNGSGKTWFSNLLPILILGQSLEGTSLKDLVNWNSDEKYFTVEGELQNNYLKQKLWIKRIVYNNTKSSELYIKLNDKTPEQLVSKSNVEDAVDTNEGNKFITKTLGISKDDLLNYYFISGNYYNPFLKASNTKKIETISRFSKSDKVDKAIEEVKEEKQEAESDLKQVENDIISLNSKIESYEEQKQYYTAEKLEEQRQNKIAQIKQNKDALSEENQNLSNTIGEKQSELRGLNLKQYEDDIETNQYYIQEQEASYNQIEKNLEKVKEKIQEKEKEFEDALKGLREKINGWEKQLEEDKGYIQEAKETMQELQLVLKDTVTCPNCNHEFSVSDSEQDIQEVKQSIQECRDIIKQIEEEDIQHDKEKITEFNNKLEGKRQDRENSLEDLKTQRIEYNSDLSEIQDSIKKYKQNKKQSEDKLHNLKQKQQNLQLEIDKLSKKITQNEEEVTNLDSQLEEEKNRKLEDQSGEIDKKVRELQKSLKRIQGYKENIEKDIANKETWINRFEDFKFYLANKPIQTICQNINFYLKKIGSDLSVEIEGFKRLKSGKIKQELTPQIYRNGMNPQGLGNFSGGEKARLNLSCDLAFQNIINGNSNTGGFSFYSNDELLNPVDSEGIANVAKAFNELNKTILLISHSGSDLQYDNIIKVIKENNVSYINYE